MFAEDGVSKELHVGHIVSVLSISLFAIGLGLGPLIVGPLSEIYGRNPIYRISYGLFFALAWPVAFAPNIGAIYRSGIRRRLLLISIAVFLVFRMITGFCGSAFLSVAGGSISDLFTDATVAKYGTTTLLWVLTLML